MTTSAFRRGAITLIKWIWLLAVLGAAVKYLYDHHEVARSLLSGLPLPLVLASGLLLVVAKLLLAQNARLAARQFGAEASYRFYFRSYNLSQLGKYLPGSIWQFIGRYAIYRAHGFTFVQSRDAILAETGWALGGAVIAAFLVLTAPPQVIAKTLGATPDFVVATVIAGVVLAALSGLLILVRGAGAARSRLAAFLPPASAIVVQAIAWLSLGLSFWFLVYPATGYAINPVFATGLFSLAYAAGFLVPFAPAGIGVREGILVAGLAGVMAIEQAVMIAIMARLLYVLVELGLALLSISWNMPAKPPSRSIRT